MDALKTYFTATKKVEKEYANHSIQIEGTLPKEIQGTLFRNGNGRFEHQEVKYEHLFDGDGMVTKFVFKDGQLLYSNKYVRTQEFVEEEAAGKMLYRSFGTNIPGGIRTNFFKMKFKNAANTSLIHHGGKLLALWEGGLPHEIDPYSLETISRYDYNGVLINDFSWLDHKITPELPFSAHPKVDKKTGILHNFGTAAGTKQRLVLYKVDPKGVASIDHALDIGSVTFTHDFVLTDSGKRIFFLTPVAFDLFKTFSGLQSPVASIKINKNNKTKILVVEPDGATIEYETDFCFVFHFANGYEENNKLVIDGYILNDFPDAESTKQFLSGIAVESELPKLTRFEIDLSSKEVNASALSEYPGELPFINPDLEGKPYQYSWNISGPSDTKEFILTGVAKVDVQNKDTLLRDFAPSLTGEPVFVPAENPKSEDDGYLIMLLFNTELEQTELHILRADDLSSVAKGVLPHNIPLGFHGFWTDSLY
ncbi:MAG: carotenoid oxygenase family protein [Bacteroidota bacterium]